MWTPITWRTFTTNPSYNASGKSVNRSRKQSMRLLTMQYATTQQFDCIPFLRSVREHEFRQIIKQWIVYP